MQETSHDIEQVPAWQHTLEYIDKCIRLDKKLELAQQISKYRAFGYWQTDYLDAFTVLINVHSDRIGQNERPEEGNKDEEVWEVRDERLGCNQGQLKCQNIQNYADEDVIVENCNSWKQEKAQSDNQYAEVELRDGKIVCIVSVP